MRQLLAVFAVLLPQGARMRLLRLCGHELHPTSSVGRSLLLARKIRLEAGARVGSLTVIKGLDEVHLGENARIGNLCWITAFPAGSRVHFAHLPERRTRLVVGRESAITHRHLIDCTDEIVIGEFTTVAGYRSQFLTHSIDLAEGRQSAKSIQIGDYCFVGTAVVVLGGSSLPDHSVLGAQSLLNKEHKTTYTLYAGVPAEGRTALASDAAYFKRLRGFVD